MMNFSEIQKYRLHSEREDGWNIRKTLVKINGQWRAGADVDVV